MSKYKQIKVNVTEDVYEKLVQIAKKHNITLAELFRLSVEQNGTLFVLIPKEDLLETKDEKSVYFILKEKN